MLAILISCRQFHAWILRSQSQIFMPSYFLQGVLDGKYDDLPEQSFYMVGGIAEKIAAQ